MKNQLGVIFFCFILIFFSGCSISGMDEQLESCEDTMLALTGEMKWK